MLGRLQELLFGNRQSKQVAKERLRFVLLQDRTHLTPDLVEAMQEDIVKAISKYVDIDASAMEVELNREGESLALVASIPVRGIRRMRHDREA